MTTTLVATDLKLFASVLIRTGCELPDVVRMLRAVVNRVHFRSHAKPADRAWRQPMRRSLLLCDAEGDCFVAH